MSRQSEFKKKLNPELGRYTRQHIYGEGIMDVFKSFGKKIFGKTMKKAAKKGAEKAVTSAATKTGEYAGKKAGDKIVQMLTKEKAGDKIVQMLTKEKAAPPAKKITFNKNDKTIPNKTMSQQEINQRVNSIMSGGKLYNY